MAEDDGLQRFLAVAASHRLLTAPEEIALGRRVQAGDIEARNELVLSNIRLVVSIARYYRNRGLAMEDVVQEGIRGLNRAAEKFDPDKGIRFSTYATLWIKQAIQRGLTSGGAAIRLPSTVASVRGKVRRARLQYPDADAEFLADLLDLDLADVERALDAAEVVTSLDREVVSEEHTHTMLDAMPDHEADDPQVVVGESYGNDIEKALNAMVADAADPRRARQARRVIEMTFGLGVYERQHSVEEIAKAIKQSANTVKTRRREAFEYLEPRLAHLRTSL